LQAKTGFESGSSPTLHVIREPISRAFYAIRVPVPQQAPTPSQAHVFVYTKQHEERFKERAKKLTLESLAYPYVSKSRRGSVWEIKASIQTAKEPINEILWEGRMSHKMGPTEMRAEIIRPHREVAI